MTAHAARRSEAMSVEMIPTKDLVSNPYRHIERYQFNEEKIEALLKSYENSGFWDGSIQGRLGAGGKVEIAFGHHRVEAAKRAKIPALGVVLADRSEADMLRMMGDENRAEFKHDAFIGVETIRAVIEAYARGEIELEPVSPKTRKDAIHVLPGGNTYDLGTVARFLGWVKPSDNQATTACKTAFDAYQSTAATEGAILTLEPSERSEVAIKTVTDAAKVARTSAIKANLSPAKVREAEKRAATEAAKEIKETSGFKARGLAKSIGTRAVKDVASGKAKAPPPVELYMAKLIEKCEKAEPYSDILTECRRLIPFVDDLNKAQSLRLAVALEAMLKRSAVGVVAVAKALRDGNAKRVTALLEKGA